MHVLIIRFDFCKKKANEAPQNAFGKKIFCWWEVRSEKSSFPY